MKKVLLIALLIVFLAGCSYYDRGYGDGWEAAKNRLLYSFSSSYRKGYDNGWYACDMFNKGYYDSKNDFPPKYEDNKNYMWGYEEGR